MNMIKLAMLSMAFTGFAAFAQGEAATAPAAPATTEAAPVAGEAPKTIADCKGKKGKEKVACVKEVKAAHKASAEHKM